MVPYLNKRCREYDEICSQIRRAIDGSVERSVSLIHYIATEVNHIT